MPAGAAVAVRELAPAAVPSVQEVAAAMPEAFVATAPAGSTDPPPVATAKVTATPETGLLLTSRTSTAGGVATAVPAVAVWAFPALTAIWVGAPAVSAMDVEVAVERPVELKLSVRAPTVTGDRQPSKRRQAVRVGVDGGRPAERPATRGDRDRDGADAGHRIARGILCLHRRLLRERDAILRASRRAGSPSRGGVAAPAPRVMVLLVAAVSAPEVNRRL